MNKFYYKYSLYLALTLFVVSITVATKVFAFEKPITPTYNTGSGYTQQTTTYQPTTPIVSPTSSLSNTATNTYINTTTKALPSTTPVPSGSVQQQSHVPAFAQVKLQGAKLKACQTLSSTLVTRSNHLVELVDQQEKTFTSIALGVEQYYLTKVVPTGSSLSSYDTLVAKISTQQNAVTAPLQAAQNDITNFSCTGNNPAAQLTQFRTDMQAVLTALETYRISIKNLIVAIVSMPSITPTPTPTTKTVTVTP